MASEDPCNGGGGQVKLLGRTLKDLANLISHQAALP